MLTTIDLPDALYRESEALAVARNATVEQLIVESVTEFVHGNARLPANDPGAGEFPKTCERLELPVIRSKTPGVLNLADFDFDDLLA
jgi:hypothetical protein